MKKPRRNTNQPRKNSLLSRRESAEVQKTNYFNEDGFLVKPIPKRGRANDLAFLSISAQILKHWEVVNSNHVDESSGPKRTTFDKHNNPPFSRTQNFTKRCVYELGCAVIDSELCTRLERFTKRLYGNDTEPTKIYNTAPSSKSNPFAWCQSALKLDPLSACNFDHLMC